MGVSARSQITSSLTHSYDSDIRWRVPLHLLCSVLLPRVLDRRRGPSASPRARSARQGLDPQRCEVTRSVRDLHRYIPFTLPCDCEYRTRPDAVEPVCGLLGAGLATYRETCTTLCLGRHILFTSETSLCSVVISLGSSSRQQPFVNYSHALRSRLVIPCFSPCFLTCYCSALPSP